MGAIFWIPAIIIAAIALLLHAASVLLTGRLGNMLSYINVAVHLFGLLFLLYHRISLEVSLLALMSSALVYLVISFVSFNMKKCGKEEIENDL